MKVVESTINFEIEDFDITLWYGQKSIPIDYSKESEQVRRIIDYYFKQKPSKFKLMGYLATLDGLKKFHLVENNAGVSYGTMVELDELDKWV